ncbi:MAG: PilZ domain-containing protein, partial [Desulfovibrionaceae bacterium]
MHTEERRRWFREELPKPTLALLHQEVGSATPRNHPNRYFVEVNDLAEGGCSLVTDNRLDKDSEVSLLLMAPDSEQWSPRNGRVVWVCKLEHSSLLQAGIEYRNTTEHDTAWTLDDHSLLPTHEDQDFLLNTDLLQAIPFRYLPPLLNRMTLHTFAPGERIIRQNDKGEELY